MKKKIAIVLAVLAVCAAFLACGNNEYVGTYKSNFNDITGRTTISLTLKSGGKCELYRLGQGETVDMLEEGYNLYPGKYTVKDNTITITLTYHDAAASQDITDSIEGTVLSNGNISIVLFGSSRNLIKQKD